MILGSPTLEELEKLPQRGQHVSARTLENLQMLL